MPQTAHQITPFPFPWTNPGLPQCRTSTLRTIWARLLYPTYIQNGPSSRHLCPRPSGHLQFRCLATRLRHRVYTNLSLICSTSVKTTQRQHEPPDSACKSLPDVYYLTMLNVRAININICFLWTGRSVPALWGTCARYGPSHAANCRSFREFKFQFSGPIFCNPTHVTPAYCPGDYRRSTSPRFSQHVPRILQYLLLAKSLVTNKLVLHHRGRSLGGWPPRGTRSKQWNALHSPRGGAPPLW